jgi:hypothetical protein
MHTHRFLCVVNSTVMILNDKHIITIKIKNLTNRAQGGENIFYKTINERFNLLISAFPVAEKNVSMGILCAPYLVRCSHRPLRALFDSLSHRHQIVFDLSFWSRPCVHYTSGSERQTTAGQRNIRLANAAPPPYLFISWQWRYLADLTSGHLQMVFVFIAHRVCVRPQRLVSTTIHYIVFLGNAWSENLSDGKKKK